MTLPNFLLIGAAKSGTSSLYDYLGQHPEIFVSPVKEPNFFALEGEVVDFQGPGDDRTINAVCITDIERYRALFREADEHAAVGEASTLYLYSSKAPERIKHYLPNARLIAVLRNPVERAFSSFLHLRLEGREPHDTFERALAEEPWRIGQNWQHLWHYRAMGLYAEQLERYYRAFGAEQLMIFKHEDLLADPVGVVQRICRFLAVDDSFVPDVSVKYKVSGTPRSPALHRLLARPTLPRRMLRPLLPRTFRRRLLERLKQANMKPARPEIPSSARALLLQDYRDDIARTQQLVELDLTSWLLEPASADELHP